MNTWDVSTGNFKRDENLLEHNFFFNNLRRNVLFVFFRQSKKKKKIVLREKLKIFIRKQIYSAGITGFDSGI